MDIRSTTPGCDPLRCEKYEPVDRFLRPLGPSAAEIEVARHPAQYSKIMSDGEMLPVTTASKSLPMLSPISPRHRPCTKLPSASSRYNVTESACCVESVNIASCESTLAPIHSPVTSIASGSSSPQALIASASPRPSRLYPLRPAWSGAKRPIVIDPRISFGRPTVAGAGVSTEALANRIDAGESAEDLAWDYGLEVTQIEDAVLYERAA